MPKYEIVKSKYNLLRLTFARLTHSLHTTKIARIICYTMLSTVFKCKDVQHTVSVDIKCQINILNKINVLVKSIIDGKNTLLSEPCLHLNSARRREPCHL